MNTRGIEAPVIVEGEKVTGPASYFPSIEERYGEPMQHWIDLAVAALDAGNTHMAVVAKLKSEQGLGHGHANAIVAYVRSRMLQ